jgi:RHS repeat-associated protein
MRMKGEVQGNGYTYVEQIDYDHFEQRTYIKYGNQTENRYAYTPNLRRLDHLISTASNGQDMLNNTYSYDQVGNVEQLSNSATFNDTNQLGGIYTHSYDYDNLNRLVGAHGDFVGNNTNSNTNTANYELAMEYNTTHGILYKKQFHHKNNAVVEDNTYKHHYTYKEGTHQVEKIEGGDVNEHYYYDANGNLEHRTTSTGDMRHLLWDESDRLRVLMDRDQMHHFIYDASGNRTLKASTHYEQVFENGQLVQNQNATLENYTTYASAYLVLDANKQYSKHYYVGSERIATQLGSKSISVFEENLNLKSGAPSKEITTAQRQVADLEFLLKDQKMNKVRFAPYKQTAAKQAEEIDSTKARATAAMVENPRGIYFFHNDHLGTGTFLTDGSGNPYQFFVNLPFGETFFEQHSYTEDYNNPYKFNGKELDEETGFYYYGARYYDPRISIWMSTDPLAEKYPNESPYIYCGNNPINAVDPNGEEKIVLCGAQKDNSPGNKLMFVNQGLRALKNNRDNTDEKNTMLLMRGDYTAKQLNRIKQRVEHYGGDLVLIDNAKDAINYVNNRTTDKVSKIDVFTHGTVNNGIELAHNFGLTGTDINSTNVGSFSKSAFSSMDSTINLYSCRSAISGNNSDFVNPFNTGGENSVAQLLSNATGATVNGFERRTDYSYTFGSRTYNLFNGEPKKETISGALFTPNGAVFPPCAGSTPTGTSNAMLQFKPTK